jgi:hypothetical protein
LPQHRVHQLRRAAGGNACNFPIVIGIQRPDDGICYLRAVDHFKRPLPEIVLPLRQPID